MKGKSEAVPPLLPALPRRGASLTCPWWKWNAGGRGCTGQHRCASLCRCCSHLSRRSGGETQHEPGQQQQPAPTLSPATQHSPLLQLMVVETGSLHQPQELLQQSLSLPTMQVSVDKDGKRPNPKAAFLQERRSFSLYTSRVHARSGWEGESHTPTTGR